MNTHDIDIELPPLPDWFDGYSEADKLVVQVYARAAVEADRKQHFENGGALQRYKECGGDEESDPIERLRVYCSLAMSGQDWLDAEPFFDAPAADRKRRGEPVEADKAYDKIDRYLRNSLYDDDYAEYSEALDAVYGAPQPAEPMKVPSDDLRTLQNLLSWAEAQICLHEETHRGGAIWEICDQCGAKWADDEGGKPEFEWPDPIVKARALLSRYDIGQPAANAGGSTVNNASVSNEPEVPTTQVLITLGKVIAGYLPGEEGWSEYDQQAYDAAISVPQPLSESDIPAPVAQEPVSVTERWQDGDDSNMVSRVDTTAPVATQVQPVVNQQMTTAASDVLADTQRAIIEAAERRGYERAIAECAQDREDAQRLDWLDAQNARFRVGWHVGRAPAGNVRIDSVIVTGRSKLTSIREAIDAARAAKGQS